MVETGWTASGNWERGVGRWLREQGVCRQLRREQDDSLLHRLELSGAKDVGRRRADSNRRLSCLFCIKHMVKISRLKFNLIVNDYAGFFIRIKNGKLRWTEDVPRCKNGF